MYALSAYLAGRAFLAFGGHVGLPNEKSFPAIIAPFAAAALVLVAANHGLLSGVLWLTRPRDRMSSGSSGGGVGLSARLLLSDIGYAAYGLLMAALWSVVGFFAPLLVLIPLFVARWAVAQFAEQQKAYEATVGALCQAVETKDFYTRGHSDRVSRGSVMIAREIGMRGERVEAIRYAGMLHDVGKLGVPTKVLQKTGKLTEEEYAAIQLHPMRGLDIVREIGFLDEALAGIMHHHERICHEKPAVSPFSGPVNPVECESSTPCFPICILHRRGRNSIMNRIPVALFNDRSQAEPIQSRLAEAGVAAEIHDEPRFDEKLWFISKPKAAVRVDVPANQFEHGEQLLVDWDSQEGALHDAIHCPECKSLLVEYPQMTRRSVLTNLAMGVAAELGLIEKQYYCRECHFTWPREGKVPRPGRPHMAPYYFIEGVDRSSSASGRPATSKTQTSE